MSEQTTEAPSTEKQPESVDIFLWANQTDAKKDQLDVEFFLFNKNYTPYTTNFLSNLNTQIKPLFLYDILNEVNMGAGTGLAVREFEMSEAEDNVLLRTKLTNVGRAETLLHLIEHERHDIVEFSEEDHEFKRIKGIVARFTHKDAPDKPFYVVKAINQGNILQGAVSWEFKDGKFGLFQAQAGIKMPADNQVLIVDQDIFVFSTSKFEKLFQYDYKKQALADQRVEEISTHYKLSFPEGLDLQMLVRDRAKIVNKLQKMEIGGVSQEQALEYADEMQLELMTDDKGAIIIMDAGDLDMFVNLINEDYITSHVTGKRYEIKTKRLLDEPDGEPPRG